MSPQRYYTTQLQAGLGLLEETRQLLQVYQPGMSASQLYETALASGRFPLVSARRLRNIVAECFAPRYMRAPYVAPRLKSLVSHFTTAELTQLLFIYTARANLVLADFVRDIYWARYSAGRNDLQLEDARTFVANSVREGKTQKPWSETTIKRISSYLMGCCADYGLLSTTGRNQRSIAAYRILPKVAAYLAYDLKFSGLGDNQIVTSSDWALFGLEQTDIREQLKRLSLQGLLIFQGASDVVHIGWAYKNMEELIDVIAQS
ncbi:DUF1819 family protein [Aeromonas hydrophila]|uniref:BrxA family protein n=1 Tax=Aeromonas hydrophila TaxID=644 RepID=UPI001F4C3508|nr:BrxA family protein [Aeromonas hydrophila]MCO4198689.1 DUF1819 family protein [Aeromonas hydrophila]UNB60025.1 DUF1819 family protein [Aeromonas hydrophila]